jgi:hypothetical protein
MEFYIYVAVGMLTLFLSTIQALRQERGGEPVSDEGWKTCAFASFALWPLVLPMMLALLLFWKPPVKADV